MKFKNTKLSKDYTSFAIITILSVLIMVLIYTYLTYNNYLNNNSYNLKTEAKIIENTISESFDYTNQINSYIGRQIVDHKRVDLNFILELFHKAEKIKNKNADLFSWSSFDWDNKNNYQTVNSRLGIRKDPPDMSARKFTITARKNPWTLQVAAPTLGNPSNAWVIPAGTGIADEKGNFLGIVAVGFNIAEFTSKLEKRLIKNASFVVLDENLNIIMQSSDNSMDKRSDFYRNNLSIAKLNNSSGILEEKIKVGDIYYSTYQKLDKYPYIILTGFNQKLLNKEFNNLILPRILEFIGLAIFFLIILYIFEARIISLLKIERELKDSLIEANATRTKLIKSLSGSLSHELRSPLATIRGGISIVRINLEKALGIFQIPDQKNYKPNSAIDRENIIMSVADAKESLECIKLCDDVIDQSNMIIDLTLEKIHEKPLDKNKFLPNSILDSVNLAIRQYAFKPGEKEKVNVLIKDDFIFLGIKEMLLFVIFNLLKNSLYYASGKRELTITIYTSKTLEYNRLHFKDNGPGITEEIISTIFDNFITSGKDTGTGLGLPFCKRIMDEFGGKIECVSKLGVGAEFILSFPVVR